MHTLACFSQDGKDKCPFAVARTEQQSWRHLTTVGAARYQLGEIARHSS